MKRCVSSSTRNKYNETDQQPTIMDPKTRFRAFLLITLPLFIRAAGVSSDLCGSNTLAVYKLRMDTHWSEEAFPKQYPHFRPPAQFSRLLGMVHNTSYVLWRDGSEVTPEIRTVAEKGTGELLEQKKGVQDVFAAPAVFQGVGSTETILYSDGKHTLVSLISKIVPSPDWFVGLDSFELCVNGHWINNASIHAGPFDAGTDDGFTFTAPNWPTDPMIPIAPITSQEPSHPANSFYYPELKTLPPLVTFHLIKERVYRATNSNRRVKRKRTRFSKTNPVIVPLPKVPNLVSPPDGPLRKTPHAKRVHRKSARRPVDCVMSSWTSWSACSASCGVGFERRTRTTLKPSKRGGSCSKTIQQQRWCGDQSKCIDRYFNW